MSETQKPEWVKHFKLDDPTWESLVSQSQREKRTPLDLAIDLNLVSETKLLDFERERTGMATLKPSFFSNITHPDFLESENYDECRKHACLPLAKWEGITFWAKLSGHKTALESQLVNVVWILAPWSGMKKLFDSWKAKVRPEKAELKKPEIKLDLPFDSEPTKTAIDATVINDAPVGLADSVSAASIDFGNLKIPKAEDPASDFEIEIEAPKPVPPKKPAPTVKEVPEMLRPVAVTPAPAPVMPAAPVAPAPQTAHSAISLSELEDKLRSAQNQDQLVDAMLAGWKNFFDNVMVLLFQSDQLIIWRWGGKWLGQFQSGQGIPLDTPSIFKIVADTASPYHGHVSSGPINDRFFKHTNNSVYPEHVTIIPVLADRKVIGMVFGSCSNEAGKKLVLPKLDDHVKVFATHLIRLLNPVSRTG